ncbi:MAG: restriction endonuclease, partial [Opitutaceae bacterium]
MSAAPFDIGAKASWNTAEIRRALSEIDWIQFERFCAVLLRAEGFAVIRQGGAQPDSGVDLIAEKDGQRNLVQCKHRHASALQEEVVREMSDRMTQFEVKRGTVFTLNGWTQPAAEFAASHGITLVDGSELGRRAAEQLPVKELNDVFNLTVHHCPKCDA